MKDYKKEGLQKMRDMHAFIAANPGCTMVMLCAHFEQSHTSLRTPLLHLRDGEFIEVAVGARSFQGQAPSTYTVTDKPSPLEYPARKEYGTITGKQRADQDVKRIIKPAKQIGMTPYRDLPVEFFRRQVGA